LAIRKARAADLPAVMAIEREQFSNPWSDEHFQVELVNSFSQFYVAVDQENSALAGFLIFLAAGRRTRTAQNRGRQRLPAAQLRFLPAGFFYHHRPFLALSARPA